MNNEDKYNSEYEVILTSFYIDVISRIVSNNPSISVIKLVFFSFLIKKEHFRKFNTYSGNTSRDLINKVISLASGSFDKFCDNISYIFFAIHLLKINNKIEISSEGKCIWISSDEKQTQTYGKIIIDALKKSFYVTDDQFLKEVVANV